MKQAPSTARAVATPDESSAPESDVHLGLLDDLIPFHLRQAQNASFRAFARRVGRSDLQPGRYATMMLIHLNPGITQKTLSQATGRDTSSLTPVLRDLALRGLIERRQMPSDRRSFALSLTPEGERALEEMARHAQAHDRQVDAIVGDMKQELLALLRRITAELS